MSGAAWMMMLGTWGAVIGVTGYLMWKVVARPGGGSGEGEKKKRKRRGKVSW